MSAIHGIVGANGTGKTLAAVELFARPRLDAGERVVSNFRLMGAERLSDYRAIPDLGPCLLIIDEISAAFPSRESSKLPAQIVRRLNQCRKVPITVVWTAPSWKRCDTVLREVTGRVTWCHGYLGKRPVTRDGKPDPLGWRQNRLFRWDTYSSEDIDEFRLGVVNDQAGSRKLRRVSRRWYWRPGGKAQGLYNTLEEVDLLGHLDEYGTCFDCGGTRRRPKCGCITNSAQSSDDTDT